MKDLTALAERFRVADEPAFALAARDTGDTWELESKKKAGKYLDSTIDEIRDLQEMLYAQKSQALLLIFQAMDAAGKDSTIEHVMSGINPQGCSVYSFKQPSEEELNHDFLWRSSKALPERGRIGIFNRSYYEEVLVVRVHPPILEAQKLPERLVTDHIWQERFEDIRAYEKHLTRNGTVIRKFFLNVSLEEQKERFLARLDDPSKHWKFSSADLEERALWLKYQQAYQETIRATATAEAPWHVIPADHKWFMRLAVATVIAETLRGMKLDFPEPSAVERKELKQARAQLEKM